MEHAVKYIFAKILRLTTYVHLSLKIGMNEVKILKLNVGLRIFRFGRQMCAEIFVFHIQTQSIC